MSNAAWPDTIFEQLLAHHVQQVAYVPDAGHSQLIERCRAHADMITVPLTTEEEGVALLGGAWLGGQRGVLLMQSSGVGNCINMLSLVSNCRFPFLTIVTMRGESGEFNPWQVAMGRATPAAFELMGVSVRRASKPEDVGPTVEAALHDAFMGDQPVAVLLSQVLLGRKKWER